MKQSTVKPSQLFVGRHFLRDDANSEIKLLNNNQHPLELQFYGLQSENFRGHGKEFFRIALNHIKTSFLVKGELVKILGSRALIVNQSYYAAGVILGNEMTN